jgi:hypothetical protein
MSFTTTWQITRPAAGPSHGIFAAKIFAMAAQIQQSEYFFVRLWRYPGL